MRCGHQIKNDQCVGCNEFGIIKKEDFLYTKEYQKWPDPYVKEERELLFTKLQEGAFHEIIKCQNKNKTY